MVEKLSFKGYLIALLLAGLFLIALYNFGTGLKTNYGQDDAIVDTDKIDLTSLEERIEETSESSRSWQQTFTSDNFFVSLGAIVLFSLWGIFKLMWTVVNSLLTIYLQGITNVIGLDPIVTGVITAILIIGLIFAVWRSIKTGE